MSLKGFDVLYAEGKEMETSHVVKEQSLFDTDEAHFHTEKAMNVVDSPFVEDSTSQKIVAQKPAKVFLVSSVKDKQMSSFRTSLLTSPRSFTENTTVFVWDFVFPKQIEKKNTHKVIGAKDQNLFSWSMIWKSTQKAFHEVKVFVFLFVAVLGIFYFFTNAQLIAVMAHDAFSSEKVEDMQTFSDTLIHNAAGEGREKKTALDSFEQQMANFDLEKGDEMAQTMKEFLDQKGVDHSLTFNVLPPTNRLIIPDLNINVPLVDTETEWRVDFSDETFDDELTKGVVKYPTTPNPGEKGNTLLFGHTSTEWWKKNEYGVVFRNIPKLKAGQRFQVLWNGQLYTYEMVERKVVLPKKVEEYYHVFAEKDESYVTLMGCYPIGTADKRMMVVAKLIDTK